MQIQLDIVVNLEADRLEWMLEQLRAYLASSRFEVEKFDVKIQVFKKGMP